MGMKLQKGLPVLGFFPLSNASFPDDVSSFLIAFPEDYKYTPALKLNDDGILPREIRKMQELLGISIMFLRISLM